MVEVHSSWFQPDSQETRERMRIATSTFLGPVQLSHPEHEGVISNDDFLVGVLLPCLARVWQGQTYQDNEQAYTYIASIWTNTLGPSFPGVEPSYEVDLVAVGAATHLQDPWVGDLLTDLQNDIIAQVLAGTHPGVPAGLMSFSVEFETDEDLYPGTVSSRVAELSMAEIESHAYDRAGNDLYPGETTGHGIFDPLWALAIPRSESDPGSDDPDFGDYAADPIPYAAGGPLGTPPNVWSSGMLELRATAEAPETTALADALPLGSVSIDSTVTLPIDDGWWEANKWEITRFGPDVNYGVPLMLTPEWLVLPALIEHLEPYEPYGGGHTSGSASATLYMNAVWTPPRYRIIYDVDSTAIPPRRIFGRSDGATHGARRALGGGNTRQSGSRTLGSIL